MNINTLHIKATWKFRAPKIEGNLTFSLGLAPPLIAWRDLSKYMNGRTLPQADAILASIFFLFYFFLFLFIESYHLIFPRRTTLPI
jgi:hypothetical protein